MPKYLTKSRFTLALQCPTKLYYLDRSAEYANLKLENEYLEALAEGGFQVGELAKYYFPGGYNIKTLDYTPALDQTYALLERENVIIYEAAVRYEDFFIRIDILKKDGNKIDIVEVKAKSFHPEEDIIINAQGYLNNEFIPYLQDVAFQTWVVEQAFPNWTIEPYLMLADKSKKTTVNGLNQIFRVKENEQCRKEVILTIPEITPALLGEKILVQIPVREYVDQIFRGLEKDPTKKNCEEQKSFIQRAVEYAQYYKSGRKFPVTVGAKCKECEFRCDEEARARGLRDGFIECWQEATSGRYDPSKPHIFNIWNCRNKDHLLSQGKFHIENVERNDICPKTDGKPGLSVSERQWLQIEKVQDNDLSPFIDLDGLKSEIEKWTFPLHFIDFETSAVAIPFNVNRHPYEGVAFQWSHHNYLHDGTIEHKGQFLNSKRGCFPNFEFIRSLKAELECDNGTIFRYANHENTFLNIIFRQLYESTSAEIPDRSELMHWIKTISHSTDNAPEKWCGNRDMVDMWQLVKRYIYFPETNGSNSIKAVLPAILRYSKYLQEKYSRPVYGAEGGIKSHNYQDWVWVRYDKNGAIKDPYKLLPPLFEDVDELRLEGLVTDQNLADGGAAMTAYAKLQFADIGDWERTKIQEGLLRYCELDTMAMVMIWEFIRNVTT